MLYENEIRRVIREVRLSLEQAGFKSSIIPVHYLSDLKADILRPYSDGVFDEKFYRERLAHYQFDLPKDFPTASSIILTATPQPVVNVTFTLSDKIYTVIVPPTYSYDTDERALSILRHSLHSYGYKVSDAVLPVKLLAVHSGLALYGRNNITYIDGWGSYFRLKAFYSDMPFSSDTWLNFTMMDRCERCMACVKCCPTKAIPEERFVFHAERCLTFINEGEDRFPGWIDPAWHNCLIGCMVCQDVCPVNTACKNWLSEEESFSEEETRLMLSSAPANRLPDRMIEKLKRLYLWDEYSVLERNLRVMLNEIQNREESAS
jgi:epoxyqueuosine reductase